MNEVVESLRQAHEAEQLKELEVGAA
jgi:hypothetical protein